jgi:DnaJ-class molecular chaperone
MSSASCILNISADASRDEIKSAYHKLAKRYHPDKPGGNPAMFQRLKAAYDILMAEKSSIIPAAINPYNDTTIVIGLDIIINGSIQIYHLEKKDKCQVCQGTYAYSASDYIRCITCNGRGYYNNTQCYNCLGKGFAYKSARRCKAKCKGGFILKKELKKIQIPRAIPDNHVLVLQNSGGFNRKLGRYNHLRIRFRYDLPEGISIKGRNIYCNPGTVIDGILYDTPGIYDDRGLYWYGNVEDNSRGAVIVRNQMHSLL